MATRTRSRFPHAVQYSAGPFQGMVDSPSPKLQKPNLATNLHNVVPDISGDGGIIGRPGFTRLSANQMGVVGSFGRAGQCAVTHTSINTSTGATVRRTFIICGGKVYRVTWGVPNTLTDVTPVDVTITAGATVYAVPFADTIIVSDGVNRPWKMTSLGSTPVVGTYLTGVPEECIGPPVVYYAKLFFIKSSEQNTIIWSEENDPDLGYEVDFNNAWTLSQTSQEPLVALCATNDALYYFRAHSIGAITGAVSADFANAGVHDSVSTSEGTASPRCIVRVGNEIHFIDEMGFPHVIRGNDAIPIWRDIGEALGGFGVQTYSHVMGNGHSVYSPDLDMLLIAHPRFIQSASSLSKAYQYHLPSERWYGTIEVNANFVWLASALIVNDNAQRLVLMLDDDGYAFYQTPQQDNDPWDRTDGSTAEAVANSVTTPILGYSETVQQQFDMVDLTVRGFASNTPTYAVTWNTPRTAGTTQNLAFTAPVAANRDVKASLGINAQGRGVSLTIAHSSATTRFSLHHVRVSGTAVSDAPNQY